MNPGSTYQVSDVLADLKNWWFRCPFWTRGTLFFTSFLYILRLISVGIAYVLINYPYLTVGSFQITRIFFSPFVFMTLLELSTGLFAYLPFSAQNEKSKGTLRSMVEFTIINIEVNVVYLVLCYTLSIISSYFLELPAYGLWNVFLVYLIQKCLEDPDGTISFLCFPLPVKARYYPLILMALFSILSDQIRLDMFAGFLVGLLHGRLIGKRFNDFLNINRISSWENTVLCAWIRTLPHYVPSSHLSGPLMDLRGNDEESFRDKRGNNYGAPGIKIFGGNEKLMKIAKESGSAYGDISEALDSNEKEYDTDLPAEKEMEMPEVEIPEKKEEVVVNQPQEEDQQPQQQNETNLL